MIYEFMVPQATKMLNNLSACLDKGAAQAKAKNFEVEVLLSSRLAPDQFDLIRQVQIASDTAKLGAAWLSGREAPVFEDNEKTLPELKARIEKTVAFLATLKKDDFRGAEERKISHARWEGKYMLGSDFLLTHAIPNLYFHVTTAYAILRHNGVEVGKKDFLGDRPFKN